MYFFMNEVSFKCFQYQNNNKNPDKGTPITQTNRIGSPTAKVNMI